MPPAMSASRAPSGRFRLRRMRPRSPVPETPRRLRSRRRPARTSRGIRTRRTDRAVVCIVAPGRRACGRIACTRASSASTNRANASPAEVAIEPAVARQRFAPLRRLHHRSHRRIRDALRSSPVMPGGATSERQFSNSTSTPCSRSVGHVESGQALGARDRERAHRAGLDLRRELGQAVDADRHLPAEDRRQRFAAAGERDVVDALRGSRRRRRRRGRRESDRCRRPTRRPTRSIRAALERAR